MTDTRLWSKLTQHPPKKNRVMEPERGFLNSRSLLRRPFVRFRFFFFGGGRVASGLQSYYTPSAAPFTLRVITS